jgi:RNA polymerase sigma-70 factor (ECF subfamily)
MTSTTRLHHTPKEDTSGVDRTFISDQKIITITTDDERLVRETFSLDPREGCALLFSRYYENLCSHAIRFVHSKEIAEDIVSELFTFFWQNRVFEQVTSSYRAYLYKAVRHRAYNHLKWQMHRTDSLDSVTTPLMSLTVSPDEAMQYTELHQKVEHIIQQLPPQCRRAYLLKRVEGKKYDEIALELRISAKAVEALVSRALAKLRKELKENWFLCIQLIMLFGY